MLMDAGMELARNCPAPGGTSAKWQHAMEEQLFSGKIKISNFVFAFFSIYAIVYLFHR
jgi:hypothetical protein